MRTIDKAKNSDVGIVDHSEGEYIANYINVLNIIHVGCFDNSKVLSDDNLKRAAYTWIWNRAKNRNRHNN